MKASGHRGPANAIAHANVFVSACVPVPATANALVSANATAHAIAAARANVSARVNVNGPPLPALKSGGRGLNPCIPCKTAYIRASGHRGPANAAVHVHADAFAYANADVAAYVNAPVFATVTVGRSRKGRPVSKGVDCEAFVPR